MNFKADIKANITLTNRDFVYSGYRPAHLIGNYLTTGVHKYLNCDILKRNQTVEGIITFISPEFYTHSLKIGMIIPFQEGANIMGYIEVLEIYNDILKMQERDDKNAFRKSI